MIESLWPVASIAIAFTYNASKYLPAVGDDPPVLDYTDAASGTFTLTRATLASLAGGAQRFLRCDPEDLGPTVIGLADEQFALLQNGGSYGRPNCCCPCAPLFQCKLKPLYDSEGTFQGLEVGARSPGPLPLFAVLQAYTIAPANCRKSLGLRLPGAGDEPDSGDLADPVVSFSVPGDSLHDAEVTIAWADDYDVITGTAELTWTDPDGIDWSFTAGVNTVPDVIGPLDPGTRFRLSATPTGSRIGFIGPYGRRALTLPSLASASGSGTDLAPFQTDSTTGLNILIGTYDAETDTFGGEIVIAFSGEPVAGTCPTSYSVSKTMTTPLPDETSATVEVTWT